MEVAEDIPRWRLDISVRNACEEQNCAGKATRWQIDEEAPAWSQS